MKNIILIIATVILLAISVACTHKGQAVGAVYISDDSTLTVITAGSESVQAPGEGHVFSQNVLNYSKLAAKDFVSAAYAHILKPGLDFSLGDAAWGSGDTMVRKHNALNNEIYAETNGEITSLSILYVNYNGITRYAIVDRMLNIKRLSSIEIPFLPADIRKKISQGQMLIAAEERDPETE